METEVTEKKRRKWWRRRWRGWRGGRGLAGVSRWTYMGGEETSPPPSP